MKEYKQINVVISYKLSVKQFG